ncbi:hypothetical protein HDU97_003512 [Phlyctochytrium planicorne]|nr:hypothetical protein HDU97_003512 [Phlyctochytrium planicorne]
MTLIRSLMTAARSSQRLKKSALLFPGQGAQHPGMGSDIYKEYESARLVIDECEEVLKAPLKRLMFEGPQSELTSTENAQPAILCHTVALLRVLEREYGFDINSCTYALGHSLGEYSALVAARSISLADAITLVRERGIAMRNSTSEKQTAMRALVINGDHLEDIEALMEKVERSLPEGEVAEIANVNSRSQVVISGTSKGVEYASSIIQTKGFAGRSVGLPVSAPFHCRLMAPAGEHMKKALSLIDFKEPVIDVISNVTGRPFNDRKEIGHLLEQQITKTVQWQRSIRFARDDDVTEWIVVGPSRVLSNLLKKEYPLDGVKSISTVNDLKFFSK